MRQADAETARAKAAAEQARAHFKALDDHNREIDLHRSRHRELWEEARQYGPASVLVAVSCISRATWHRSADTAGPKGNAARHGHCHVPVSGLPALRLAHACRYGSQASSNATSAVEKLRSMVLGAAEP